MGVREVTVDVVGVVTIGCGVRCPIPDQCQLGTIDMEPLSRAVRFRSGQFVHVVISFRSKQP